MKSDFKEGLRRQLLQIQEQKYISEQASKAERERILKESEEIALKER